jgi:hypothetical protein
MSKFGIGVGDDFPVDDGSGNANAAGQGPKSEQEEFEEWKRRRDAHRAQRDAWRAQRAEWQQRKRAFKERVRAAARESFGDRYDEYRRDHHGGFRGPRHGFPFFWPLLPILGIVLVVSLIAAIIKSPFLFLAIAFAGFMIFAYGHNHHHDRHHRGDYDFDLKPTNGRQPNTPPSGGAIVTPPPPASDNGK